MPFDISKLSTLSGHKLDEAAVEALSKRLNVPTEWKEWLILYPIAGADLSLAEEHDLSGLGAEMILMDDKDMISEAFDAYPGIVSISAGYIPFADCAMGSGDPYFFRLADGAIVRIPHDTAVDTEKDTLIEAAIEVVALSIYDLLEKVTF